MPGSWCSLATRPRHAPRLRPPRPAPTAMRRAPCRRQRFLERFLLRWRTHQTHPRAATAPSPTLGSSSRVHHLTAPLCRAARPFPGAAVTPGWQASEFPRVARGKNGAVGQNETRPPPCMRWRGPRQVPPHQVGQSPGPPDAHTGSASRPTSPMLAPDRPVSRPPRRFGSTRQGQAPARDTGFPASRTSPELPRGGARFLR
jgi:hypothetical protein